MQAAIEVLNPVARKVITSKEAAPRLHSLEGKKIGLWWNSKLNGDVALATVAERLKQRYAGVQFEDFVAPPAEDKAAYAAVAAAGVDAVVASTAD